jgi:hypothetical protein
VVLSKRERYVFVATVLVVAVLVLDQFLVSPLFARRQELEAETLTKQRQWDKSQKLVTDSKRMGKRWVEMSTVLKSESPILDNVIQWANAAGMTVSSSKPERTDIGKEFILTTSRVTGTGTVAQIGNFLWRIRVATIPVRITDMTITSKKEGTDDLSLQLGIATIYLTGEAEKKDNKPAAASAAREMWQ